MTATLQLSGSQPWAEAGKTPYVPLASVCDIIMGQAPAGDSYNTTGNGVALIAGAGDFSGGILSPKKFTDKPTKLSEPGDIVLSIRASIGDKVWADQIYCLGRGVAALRAKPFIDSKYLWHWVSASKRALMGKARGATFLQVNRSDIGELPIPLPPLDEQRRIAAILDTAEGLRIKCRQALTHLDVLTQSIFQAMVEDARALMPAMTLADLGLTFSSGKNLISSDGDAHEHNRVIKVNAVSGGVFQPSESKPLPRTYIPNEQHRIRTGDLLFTRASGSVDLIGISARVREVDAHLFLPDKIWRAEFTPRAKVCPEYLQSLFKTPAFRAFVNNAASGAAGVKNISQRSVLGFVVSAPEPAVQEKFAKHVNAIELLKDRHSAQLAELDALFAVLQNRAFKGEL